MSSQCDSCQRYSNRTVGLHSGFFGMEKIAPESSEHFPNNHATFCATASLTKHNSAKIFIPLLAICHQRNRGNRSRCSSIEGNSFNLKLFFLSATIEKKTTSTWRVKILYSASNLDAFSDGPCGQSGCLTIRRSRVRFVQQTVLYWRELAILFYSVSAQLDISNGSKICLNNYVRGV